MQVGLSNVGISNNGDLSSISIHPNPAFNEVKINYQYSHQLSIITADGKILFERTQAKANTYKIDMSNFKSGIYYFQFESQFGKKVMKVMKVMK
jgi:hypothetical protein